VQLLESDLLQPEPFAAFDRFLTQIFRTAIRFPLTRTGSPQSRLGGDKNSVIGIKCLADELLGDIGPIGIGGVDEIDSEVSGTLLRVPIASALSAGGPDTRTGQAHRPEAEAMDLDLATDPK
jgi:hypothetical protein